MATMLKMRAQFSFDVSVILLICKYMQCAQHSSGISPDKADKAGETQ